MARWRIHLLLLALTGCEMPRDPEGTFQRVHGGVIRVGVSTHAPWTEFDDDQPSGIEAALVEQFADQIGAEIEWSSSGESELMEKLETGGLDIVIGGLEKSTPWSSHVGLTRPYLTIQGEKHVMAVRAGENRWLLELEQFLEAHRGEAMRLYQQAPGA